MYNARRYKAMSKEAANFTYEEAFEELKKIVNIVRHEDPTLEESLDLYKWGRALFKRCTEVLNEAEVELEKIKSVDD